MAALGGQSGAIGRGDRDKDSGYTGGVDGGGGETWVAAGGWCGDDTPMLEPDQRRSKRRKLPAQHTLEG